MALGIQIKEGDLEILKHKPANWKNNNNSNYEAFHKSLAL